MAAVRQRPGPSRRRRGRAVERTRDRDVQGSGEDAPSFQSDVGKTAHRGHGLTPDGKKVFYRQLPNSEPKLRAGFSRTDRLQPRVQAFHLIRLEVALSGSGIWLTRCGGVRRTGGRAVVEAQKEGPGCAEPSSRGCALPACRPPEARPHADHPLRVTGRNAQDNHGYSATSGHGGNRHVCGADRIAAACGRGRPWWRRDQRTAAYDGALRISLVAVASGRPPPAPRSAWPRARRSKRCLRRSVARDWCAARRPSPWTNPFLIPLRLRNCVSIWVCQRPGGGSTAGR
ncbi:hypothetical protein GWI24_08895 [Streptomyces sp. MK37H]|nr:hypothetical protein [Streptomyces sp. MK37H]